MADLRADIVKAAFEHGRKISKREAAYVEGKGHCGLCVYFNYDLQACRIVSGKIDADDGCRYFERKFNTDELSSGRGFNTDKGV